MRLLTAGGGTGGHLFPAISIAEEFIGREPTNEVLFVGTRNGLEAKILPRLGYKTAYINVAGIIGKGVLKGALSALGAIRGVLESLAIIRRFSPHVVLGAGGYVSGPVIMAAFLLRVPTIICEQNSSPGVTNRLLGRIVDKVMATYDESTKYFPGSKTVVTGNPIRRQILMARCRKPHTGLTILVIGGSQGAHRLNSMVPKALAALSVSDLKVIHQTGAADFSAVREAYRSYGLRADVREFIDDMGAAYAEADLVISRAGAGTIAEITALGIPSVLVPYPYAAHNHQMENARVLEKRGAARVVDDQSLTPERLAEVVSGIICGDELKDMARASLALGKPDAARTIVDTIYAIGSKG
jgi:UDP-N-acetylglucosamine--N-acetylmuramyl-(pentapeptide) pyrophosphoryl-undecaprenol N-acetylglucosamine transferase